MYWFGYNSIGDYKNEIVRLKEEVKKRDEIIERYNSIAETIANRKEYYDNYWGVNILLFLQVYGDAKKILETWRKNGQV